MRIQSYFAKGRNIGPFIAIAFIAFAFLLGGGPRADSLALVILRPLAVLALGYGLFTLSRETFDQFRFAFLFALAVAGLAILHLIPLPPAMWELLPGRELVAKIDAAAGLGSVWRPIALVPQDAWNAFYSLAVPAAALVFAAGLDQKSQARMTLLFVGLGAFSILLGLIQLQGGSGSSLYFHRVTNEGSLVGLFANRNHHAIFLACLLPIFAFLANRPANTLSRRHLNIALSCFGALLVMAALIVNGSRAGFVIGLLAAAMSVLLIPAGSGLVRRREAKTLSFDFLAKHLRKVILVVIALAALGFLAISQSETSERVLQTEAADELRFKVWEPILDMSWKYFPFGSGIGSFVEAYKIDEPVDLIRFSYLNHAHNDWLEVIMTTGLAGTVLLVIAAVAWARASRQVFRRDANDLRVAQLGRVGSVIVMLLALASFVDYPLRTPALACFFAVAVVWLSLGASAAASRDENIEEK